MAENTEKKRVIRNPSLEEIENLRRTTATEALTEKEIDEKIQEQNPQPNPKEERTGLLKPKSSPFEPDSHPFTLVSGSKFVSVPKNEIYVRRMGAAEESLFYQLFSNNTMRAINNTMDAVICNCVKSDIDTYSLPINDKLPIFFKIIDLTYGPIEVKIKCPDCGDDAIIKINLLKDLKTKYIPASIQYPSKIKLTSFPGAKIVWHVGVATIGQSADYFEGSVMEVLKMLTIKLEGTVIDNGAEREITEHDYNDILSNLNETDLEAFRKFQNDFGQYTVDMNFKSKLCSNKMCISVGKEVKTELPIESIFERIIRLQTK